MNQPLSHLNRQAKEALANLRYDLAANRLEEALARAWALEPRDFPLEIQLLRQLKEAYAFREQGVHDALLQKVLQDLIQLQLQQDPAEPMLFQFLDELAECKLRMGMLPEAEADYWQALLLQETHRPAKTEEAGYILRRLARIAQRRNEPAEAARLLEAVLSLQTRSGHIPDPDIKSQLAALLLPEAPEIALQHLQEAITQEARRSGTLSVPVAKRMAELGQVNLKLGQSKTARRYIEKAIQVLEECAPTPGTQELIPQYLQDLGVVYAKAGEQERALVCFRKSSRYFENRAKESYGDEQEQLQQKAADARMVMADYLLAFGEQQEALSIYNELYNFYHDAKGQSMALARCLNRIGLAMEQLHQYEEARRMYSDAGQLVRRLKGAHHRDLHWITERLQACNAQ